MTLRPAINPPMPDPASLASPQSLEPDVDPPARKARKPRASKPAPAKSAATAPKRPRAPRTAPARTLRRRIADLGPCHLEAYDRLRKRGGEEYEAQVRVAMDARDALAAARLKNDTARMALAEASTALVEAEEREADARVSLDQLDATARALADLDAKCAPPTEPVADEPSDFDSATEGAHEVR